MSGTPIRIEPARPEHLPQVAAIYARAAAISPATFDLEGHPVAWWEDVLAAVDPVAGRVLLAAVGSDGVVAGYARSGEHKAKPAYRITCETSVYVAETHRDRGVGSALYADLLERLEDSELHLAVAGVTQPNPASARLHLSTGFTEVGRFGEIGFKLGAYWDVVWYERRLDGSPDAGRAGSMASGRRSGVPGRDATSER